MPASLIKPINPLPVQPRPARFINLLAQHALWSVVVLANYATRHGLRVSSLSVLTDNVDSIDNHADMSIVKNKRQIISADNVVQQNNIKMTTDDVGRHHQLIMTGHVVQLSHACFSQWFPQ